MIGFDAKRAFCNATGLGNYSRGIISGGMIPKIEGCLDTVLRGVGRAHIIDGRIPHSIILETFTKNGIGTMIIKEKKENYEYRK